jgi:hypothetical protein
MKKKQILVATLAVFLVGLACATARTRQPLAFAPRADVTITSSPNTEVMIYAMPVARFALRGEPVVVRSDTIRARTPLELETYLDAGEIHVASVQGVSVKVDANILHAPALHADATGRHIILESGGFGIRTEPR